MEAAFGKVSITPPINDTFPDFFFQPEGVLDEIYARVAVLKAGLSPVIIVTLDVLGIGVADIKRISHSLSPLFASSILCLTPNLCCSSITTKPKFLKKTFF